MRNTLLVLATLFVYSPIPAHATDESSTTFESAIRRCAKSSESFINRVVKSFAPLLSPSAGGVVPFGGLHATIDKRIAEMLTPATKDAFAAFARTRAGASLLTLLKAEPCAVRHLVTPGPPDRRRAAS